MLNKWISKFRVKVRLIVYMLGFYAPKDHILTWNLEVRENDTPQSLNIVKYNFYLYFIKISNLNEN